MRKWIQTSKDYHESNPNRISKRHLPSRKRHVLLRLELWSQYSKNPLQSPNPTYFDKKILNIATFNVRTSNTINLLLELTASAAEHNINIICELEHRYYYCELELKYHNTGNRWTFVSASAWENSVNGTIEGIRILLRPRTFKFTK